MIAEHLTTSLRTWSTLILLILLATGMPHRAIADEHEQQQKTSNAIHTQSDAANSERQMTNGELQQRGKQLRAALEQTYKNLAEHHELTLNTSIDDVVGKYISSGMSFEAAELILRSAGFNYSITDKVPNTPHLTATIELAAPWLTKSEIVIGLLPKVPSDFHSNVGKRFAIISHVAL